MGKKTEVRLKEPIMEGARVLVDKLVAPKFDMDLEMKYGADGNPMRMQAIEQVASPFNRHPVTGELLWFCNIHNHARYLRDIPMQPGDVLLCDNYRVLHGRNVFKGDRYHAVSWFGGLVKDRPADFDDSNENSKPGDLLNKFV